MSEQVVVTIKQRHSPKFYNTFLREIARYMGVDYTYGWYGEDRSYLWEWTEQLQKTGSIHLWVDYNVPVHTRIASLTEGEVLHVEQDYADCGWWNLIIVWDVQALVFFYAHLWDTPKVTFWKRVKVWEILWNVWKVWENGQWFHHLHLQCMRWSDFIQLRNQDPGLSTLDWYSHGKNGWEDVYPNPEKIFSK
jgi:hypothetical protein